MKIDQKERSKKAGEDAKLLPSFYQRSAPLQIGRELIGKLLFTKFDGEPITGGIIVETEAYAGPEDRASHAYGYRRTKRNEAMYSSGGVAYVYICYGIHSLLNVVTNQEGIPHAILIRAIDPTHGLEHMLKRRGRSKLSRELTAGPGALCKALGIGIEHNGSSLSGPQIWLEEDNKFLQSAQQIIASPRVGIDYAGEDALLPWRFRLSGSPWTSRPN